MGPKSRAVPVKIQGTMPRTVQAVRAGCPDVTDHIRGIVPSSFPKGGKIPTSAHFPTTTKPRFFALGLQGEQG